MMVFSKHGDTLVAHPSFLQDLKALTDSSGDLLLLGENPGVEISDLTKFFSLFVATGGNADRLGVASDHPTLQWLRDVRGAGYAKTWFCIAPLVPGSRLIDRDSLVEVPRDVCPALHVRRFDRLVLGPRMMRGQCFGRWSECRWAVAARAATRADRGELACP
jgi:hypothetical protein